MRQKIEEETDVRRNVSPMPDFCGDQFNRDPIEPPRPISPKPPGGGGTKGERRGKKARRVTIFNFPERCGWHDFYRRIDRIAPPIIPNEIKIKPIRRVGNLLQPSLFARAVRST